MALSQLALVLNDRTTKKTIQEYSTSQLLVLFSQGLKRPIPGDPGFAPQKYRPEKVEKSSSSEPLSSEA